MTAPPRRRASDQGITWRILCFLNTYARDVWLFITTIFVMVAITLIGIDQIHTAARAKALCSRQEVVLPIQLKALRGAVMAGLITQEEFHRYQAAVDEDCQ